MKNKKGFTLVELLAVIAILAIILLIAVPMILGVIEDARQDSFRNSVRGIFHAIELENARNNLPSGTVGELDLSGETLTGSWEIIDGEIILTDVCNDSYCVSTLKDSDKGTEFDITNKDGSSDGGDVVQAPTLIPKVDSYSSGEGISYDVANLYTATNGTTVCKVGEEVVSDLAILELGTHSLTCITTNSNNTSTNPITISIEIYVPYLADVVEMGDFIDYDAGTWTTTVAEPMTQGGFGGYTASTNKSVSVTCALENYEGERTHTYDGWRVLSVSGSGEDGIVTLVHAGVPECYYHAYTGTYYSAASITNLNNRAQAQYVNTTYATSARTLDCTDLQVHDATACGEEYPTMTSDVFNTGGHYWLASECGPDNLWSVYDDGSVGNNWNIAYGFRPVITLKAGLLKTGGSGASDNAYTMDTAA